MSESRPAQFAYEIERLRNMEDRRTGSERRMAISSQTAPVGDGAVVLDAVLARVLDMELRETLSAAAGYEALRDDLIARAEMGLKKYGTRLRLHNGRVAEVDVYQEILDALMYAMQCRLEGHDTAPARWVELLASLAAQLAVELNKR